MNVIAFVGRNTAGIIADYLRLSGETINTLLLVSRDEETLQLNLPVDIAEEVLQVSVKKFRAEPWLALNRPCVIICNGGTTAQQVPVIRYVCRWYDRDFHEIVFLEVTREKLIDLSD